MYKRLWDNISPLEAAAWTGDIFILRELLVYIPKSQYQNAISQLQGMLDRKETEEHGGFMAPFRALLKAYEAFNKIHILVRVGSNGDYFVPDKPKNEPFRKKLDELWYQVWLCQKNLPTYGLQEYFNKAFNPIPTFKKEPKRTCYAAASIWSFDLDGIDRRGLALYNGRVKTGHDQDTGETLTYVGAWLGRSEWGDPGDSLAIARLYEVRTLELINIISNLKQQILTKDSDSIEPKQIQRHELR
jgi:hypothetical protein